MAGLKCPTCATQVAPSKDFKCPSCGADLTDIAVALPAATESFVPPKPQFDEASRSPQSTQPHADPSMLGMLPGRFVGDVVRRLQDRMEGSAGVAADILPRTLGEYELLDVLGKGGMGVVYRARQKSAERMVALKVIRPAELGEGDRSTREEAIRRFQIESRATARLTHDHLVTVYDVGEVDGHPYYSMQYIEGESLADRLADSILSSADTARLLQPIAEAVHHAHVHGVLHRDLKPQNILVDAATDRPFVADFGLAKLLDAESTVDQTATRSPIGTLWYMAPEQTRVPPEASPATDVWALGAIIYFCVTGRPPFQAQGYVQTFKQIQEKDPAPPRLVNPDVDRDIETICLKCLAKEQERRYETADALSEELRRYLRGDPILARPPGLAEQVWRITKRHKGLVSSAATILALLAGAIWMAIVANQRTQARADDLVESLYTSQPDDLPAVIDALQSVMPRVEADLRAELASSSLRRRPRRIRASMALLPGDVSQVDYLADQLLNCEAEMVSPMVRCLEGHGSELIPSFWAAISGPPPQSPERRSELFRRACALAQWDPANQGWSTVADAVVTGLLEDAPSRVSSTWLDLFRLVSEPLRDYLLRQYDQNTFESRRDTAAMIIADWYANDIDTLIRFTILADPHHYELVADRLAEDDFEAHSIRFLRRIVSDPESLVALARVFERDAGDRSPHRAASVGAKRTANAAAVLCDLAGFESIRHMLRWRPDPEVRSFLIHRLRPNILNSEQIENELLAETGDPSVRRALLLTMGSYAAADVADATKDSVAEILRTDSDAGVHGAAEWCLRKWDRGEQIAQLVAQESRPAADRDTTRQWYVNSAGHTMVVVPPGEFTMGSPPDEPGRIAKQERMRRVSVDRSFSISSTEVSVAQFKRLVPDHAPNDWWSWAPECPMGNLRWWDAARYCNELSKDDGLPEGEWCYPLDVGEDTVLEANLLLRKGYRLPTEAEWEYACRAGTVTSRYYGWADELLPQYAWHSLKPAVSRQVGLLKPNDLGLFDMHGNAWELCNSFLSAYIDDDGIIDFGMSHTFGLPLGSRDLVATLRSHPVEKDASQMRSAMRNFAEPSKLNVATGFRVVRTESSD